MMFAYMKEKSEQGTIFPQLKCAIEQTKLVYRWRMESLQSILPLSSIARDEKPGEEIATVKTVSNILYEALTTKAEIESPVLKKFETRYMLSLEVSNPAK